MDDCAKLYSDITGKPFVKKSADYRSKEEIDESIFESVSRLFFEDRKAFYLLKKSFENGVRKKNDRLLYSTAGYFNYVDCDFEQAIKYFKESIKLAPAEMEAWFCLAFSYRQNGQEKEFNSIILHYDKIIKEFIKGKNSIEKSILKQIKNRR